MKNTLYRTMTSALALVALTSLAADPTPKKEEKPWQYKTQRIDRVKLDALLVHPEQILFVDVRRPDEVSKVGGFPVYLSVQTNEIESRLAYIPKDRTIVTVSNHAHRAGAVGDQLAAKGFKVAGAIGTQDYEEQGGTVLHIAIPPATAQANTIGAAEAKK